MGERIYGYATAGFAVREWRMDEFYVLDTPGFLVWC